MTKPKDPEVLDEMRAAGLEPEEAPEAHRAGAEDATAKETDAEVNRDEEPFDEPRAEALEPQPIEDHGPDDHHDEPHGRSLAATALMALVGAIVVIAGTLWAAPRVAPHLPAGIAQYLMPGQIETTAEIGALRQALTEATGRTDALIAALEQRVAGTEAGLGDAAARLDALPDPQATAASASEALAASGAARSDAAGLGRRVDAFETELIGLRESLAAVNATLIGAAGGDRTVAPAELAAAVAALNTRLDSLASAVANRSDLAAMDERITAVGDRLDTLEAGAAAARSVQEQALGAVSTAIREASLRSAVASLSGQLEAGQPYAGPLAEVAALAGSAPPQALAEGADAGLATAALLGASFGPRAQAAIAADVQAGSGEGTGSQVLGWLRAQVTGRPVSEQEGDSVGAVTSRIAARVGEGALGAALAEAEALPVHAQSALGSWLDQLRARVAAEAALGAWLTEIGANG